MKQSVSFYITLFILKLKGLKKNFSEDPINYKKIRKDDVHQPKGRFYKQKISQQFTVSNTTVTEIKSKKNSPLLIFIHGGAFISGPSQVHWDATKAMATQTNQTIWLCDYPKAPEHKIAEISANIDAVYQAALENYDSTQISFIGDSVGATLITALIQRLVKNNDAMPSKIILVSPVMDASLTNPAIEKVDLRDPMLSKIGILSAKKMCAENNDLKDPMLSPLYGSFAQFPKTIMFIAENDITYPDQKLAVEKLNAAQIDLTVFDGKNMPHIWPFLPVMTEAKTALQDIIAELNQ